MRALASNAKPHAKAREERSSAERRARQAALCDSNTINSVCQLHALRFDSRLTVAGIFYPDFKIRRAEFEGQNTQSIVHLGTRQIQLCLLKSALLLGVRFSYGCELMALQAPEPAAGAAASTATSVATGTAPATAAAAPPPPWRAWVAAAGGKDHLMQGVLDFKASKTDAYVTGAGQGKCNLMQVSELDTSFALRAAADAPASVSRLPFEALLYA